MVVHKLTKVQQYCILLGTVLNNTTKFMHVLYVSLSADTYYLVKQARDGFGFLWYVLVF